MIVVFVHSCRMILSYDAYAETIENHQHKDDALATLSDQIMKLMAEVQDLRETRTTEIKNKY